MLSDEELDECVKLWRGVPKWEQVAEQAREANRLRVQVERLRKNMMVSLAEQSGAHLEIENRLCAESNRLRAENERLSAALSHLNSDELVNHAHTADAMLHASIQREERLREALREIAHAPEYDGSLCPDPEDCPNCIAKEALREKS